MTAETVHHAGNVDVNDFGMPPLALIVLIVVTGVMVQLVIGFQKFGKF